MSDRPATEFQFTGWHFLGVLVAFFGVVFAVNFTLAYLANESWTGLITKDSYLAGQHYNEDLAKARQQATLGYQGKLTATASTIEFEFLDKQGAPIRADKVEIKLGRPADDEDDHVVTLDYFGKGKYRTEHGLTPGQWDADLTARFADGSQWRKIWRLYLKESAD
jgi:nitrogen fixation protein FixH